MVGGLFGILLQILFIAFKLTGYIAWSWWWVLSPLILSLSFSAFVLIVAVAFIVVQLRDPDFKRKATIRKWRYQ